MVEYRNGVLWTQNKYSKIPFSNYTTNPREYGRAFPPSQKVLSILDTLEPSNIDLYQDLDTTSFASTYHFKPDDRLYHYQNDGVYFLLERKRCILADEVGLGKTVQSVVAANLAGCDSILILTKKSLLWQWENECIKWFCVPESVGVFETNQQKKELESRLKFFGIAITNHDAIKYHDFSKVKWDCIIIDEAHHFKNRGTDRSKALQKLKSEYLFLLTATPQEKNAVDCWHYLHLCDPEKFRSYWRFENTFCAKIQLPTFTKIVGTKNKGIFQDILKQYMLRRESEVLDELSEVLFEDVQLKSSKKCENLFKKFKSEGYIWEFDKEITNAATRLIYLQQLSGGLLKGFPPVDKVPVKLNWCQDFLESTDENIVFFTGFNDTLNLYSEQLSIPIFSGEEKNSSKLINTEKAIICSYHKVGEGLNLQKFSVCVFIDLPLSYTKYHQVIGRIYRIGQKNSCKIFHLIVQNSADSQIMNLIKNKKEDFISNFDFGA